MQDFLEPLVTAAVSEGSLRGACPLPAAPRAAVAGAATGPDADARPASLRFSLFPPRARRPRHPASLVVHLRELLEQLLGNALTIRQYCNRFEVRRRACERPALGRR